MALNLKDGSTKTADSDDVEARIEARVRAEVSARVAAEVAAQLADIRETLGTLTKAAPSTAGDTSWMEALAIAISGVTDQEIGRRRVPPEEVAKRLKARERLEKAIQATVDAGVQPNYTLTQKCYLGERIIEPFWVDRNRVAQPTEIGWWGIPNEFMHPINAEAEAIHALFLESIGGTKKRVSGLRVTPGGLTVRSGGLAPEGGRDTAPRVGRDIHEATVKGRGAEQRYVEQRVLGTLMPPARQMM